MYNDGIRGSVLKYLLKRVIIFFLYSLSALLGECGVCGGFSVGVDDCVSRLAEGISLKKRKILNVWKTSMKWDGSVKIF